MRFSDPRNTKEYEERVARNRSRASPTTIQDSLRQTVNVRGVVSTRTFFTERIQQGDINNTRMLEIECLNEETWHIKMYWVLVNDDDTIEDVEKQWSNIFWGDAMSRRTIIALGPLFEQGNGMSIARETPVRSMPPYSLLVFPVRTNAELALAAARSSDGPRS
jgi:hypothetical protein